jgi:lipopolysaccharide/colanic/teichoic acid biosynthesis glycosyltransferase
MLTVRPGITDPASIVFSDEGDVLHGSSDPDLLYNQIIRPWKSRLALAYIDHRTFCTDFWLILLTVGVSSPCHDLTSIGSPAILPTTLAG